METPEERGQAVANITKVAYGLDAGACETLSRGITAEIKAALADRNHAIELALHQLEASGPAGDGGNADWTRGWHTGIAHCLETFYKITEHG